jgi:acetyl esterase/lipase
MVFFSSKTENKLINDVKVRIYRPKSSKSGDKVPIMVYYHGGGYTFGNLGRNNYTNPILDQIRHLI